MNHWGEWRNIDVLYWVATGDGEFLYNKKLEFIGLYKSVIKDAAKEYDLPEILVAGAAYNEYGAAPTIEDDFVYFIRSFDRCGQTG